MFSSFAVVTYIHSVKCSHLPSTDLPSVALLPSFQALSTPALPCSGLHLLQSVCPLLLVDSPFLNASLVTVGISVLLLQNKLPQA